jgi:hypothetical protein
MYEPTMTIIEQPELDSLGRRKGGPHKRPVVSWPPIRGKVGRTGRKIMLVATLNGCAVNIVNTTPKEGYSGGTGIELDKAGARELHRQLGEYIAQEGAE